MAKNNKTGLIVGGVAVAAIAVYLITKKSATTVTTTTPTGTLPASTSSTATSILSALLGKGTTASGAGGLLNQLATTVSSWFGPGENTPTSTITAGDPLNTGGGTDIFTPPGAGDYPGAGDPSLTLTA